MNRILAKAVLSLGIVAILTACDDSSTNTNNSNNPIKEKPSLGIVETVKLATGQQMSPTAAPGAIYTTLNPNLPQTPDLPAGFAQSTVLSPDGKTLLVLTTGYNKRVDVAGKKIPEESTQFIFVFDVSAGAPVQKQVLQVSNTYVGIAFSPDGQRFYVPGAGEDNVHVFELNNQLWAELGTPIALGHKTGNGISQGPLASGIAVTRDGKRAVVANRYNDSVSILDLDNLTVIGEQDLRPGKSGGAPGTSGGQYPNSIVIVNNDTAYVSSELDREIVVVDITGSSFSVKDRIAVSGNPNKMVLNKAQDKLFVASDNADIVSVIDTQKNTVIATVPTVAPGELLTPAQARYKGASPNGLTLSPDEKILYVTNRGTNSLAMISLDTAQPTVVGLIPTGWYPSDVRTSADGKMLYVSNAKTMPGPNPGLCNGKAPCKVTDSPVTPEPNQYIENLIGSALLSLPVPNTEYMNLLTQQVAVNNGFGSLPSVQDAQIMDTLRSNIKHVIYVVKENRTYDQVLGDLGKGNGDPNLAEFPYTTTPNQHALANQFVTLDNFYDSGDVSGNGWAWSTGARESDAGAKMLPPNYAGNGGGGSYDWEGANRNVPVGLTKDERFIAVPQTANLDDDTLPGSGDVAAPDGPDGEVQKGYLWSSALRAGLTVRNYGFFVQNTPTRDRQPFANKVIQAYGLNPELATLTDGYFRGYDVSYPEFYRLQEWEREFNQYIANGNLPNLSLVRFGTNHTGSYGTALDGVNTPEIQVADNDYAVGRLIEAVANSPYANNTLIFVVEDDAQDGPDHVDGHRSIAFVVGPYVKQSAVVSKHYTTVNMLRTITDVLGIDHLGVYDANLPPMTEVFDLSESKWSYKAIASSLLKNTALPLSAEVQLTASVKPTQPASYWIAKTSQFDFTEEDNLDAVAYNKILWEGLMKDRPYPGNPEQNGKTGQQEVGNKADKDDDDDI